MASANILSGIAFAQSQQSMTVEVFALSTMPLTNVGTAQVYYLDTVSQLEAFLSAALPSDPRQAQAIVQKRMATMGGQLQQRVQSGSVGLARAMQIGIDRAPAVVFAGKWVVYGLTDVEKARRVFEKKAAQLQ